MTTIIFIFLVLSTLGIVGVLLLLLRRKATDPSLVIEQLLEDFRVKNERAFKEEMSTNRKEVAESEKRLREELAGLFKGFGDPVERRMTDFANTQNKSFDSFSTKLAELIDKNDSKMEKVREIVEKKLESLQKYNNEKLEAIRVTVDEKLHATLEKRFGESFKVVSDRLEAVHKGLGEMQTLALGVGDLKKVLSNVKSRGTWGEAQLSNLIEEILTPEQYEKNVKIKEVVKYNWYIGVFFNNNDAFLKEKSVRQALSFTFDKPEKNRISTPLSTKSWAYTNRVKQYDKDVETAKKILTNNIGTQSASLTISTFNDNLQTAQTIAASWEAIGLQTQVKVVNSIPLDYQVLVATQEIPADPDQYAMWHSTQTETNISHYDNKKIDKLLEDGRKEVDKETRKKIYQDFQRYLVDDAPVAFLYHPTTYTIYR